MSAKAQTPALTPERQALVDELGRMPRKQAEGIARTEGAWHLLEDLVACAMAGATQAAATYERMEGVAFSDFAKHRVRGAVYDFLRHEARQRTFRRAGELAAHQAYAQMTPSADDSVDSTQDDEIACRQKLEGYVGAKLSAIAVALALEAERTEPDAEAATAMGPFSEGMRACLSACRSSDQELLRCVYAAGMDLRSAAAEVNLAYPTAKVRHRKLLVRLRECFQKRGLEAR